MARSSSCCLDAFAVASSAERAILSSQSDQRLPYASDRHLAGSHRLLEASMGGSMIQRWQSFKRWAMLRRMATFHEMAQLKSLAS
eukprot:1652867-Pleurochrysis_carterae.AAC.1